MIPAHMERSGLCKGWFFAGPDGAVGDLHRRVPRADRVLSAAVDGEEGNGEASVVAGAERCVRYTRTSNPVASYSKRSPGGILGFAVCPTVGCVRPI